ncbi:zinc-finger-containing protein [Xenorhabdus khoisanae]|uniref:zinc-finger-containing protein n=1 Tax=Xenorhabdus khoisanae TaxID=880157 RepID=UPI0032B70A01
MQFTPWNPNPRAINRVNDPFPTPTKCRYCCNDVTIAHHTEVFGRILNSKWPWLYLCTSCGARVGMHPETNIPLGTLADYPTRLARMSGKREFEEMRRERDLARPDAYRWLARRLGIQFRQCHFGWFDTDMCEKAANICRRFR